MKSIETILKDGQWKGHSCYVVGSGPSLKGFDFARLNGEFSIGCNMEFLWNPSIALCQDVRFFRRYKDDPQYLACESIKAYFKGHPHREDIEASDRIYEIRSAHFNWGRMLSQGLVYGANVGLAAINLADILGASPIYLLGFDCKQGPSNESHHHDAYPEHWRLSQPEAVAFKYNRNIEEFRKWSSHVKGYVVNATPESAIDCFDKGVLSL